MAVSSDRLCSLEERIRVVEEKIKKLELSCTSSHQSTTINCSNDVSDSVARVKSDLVNRHIFSCRFVRVAQNYYELTLQERATLLNCQTNQLCKSIVFENTACDHKNYDDMTNSRYYCVVVQYEARFDSDLLRDLIHSLRPVPDRLPKKRINFRLCKTELSAEITGFSHNSVCPLGLLCPIPVVICQNIININPRYIYVGAGEVDLKLGLSIDDFLNGLKPIVGVVSYPRNSSDKCVLDD